MQYVGGKKTIARWVADIVAAQRGDSDTYIEPFVGGGSVYAAVAPSFPRAGFGDLHPDLIALWAAVAEGWLPPENISEDEYKAVRAGPVCALRGFVGFGCSFGGKWFGGYARAPKTPQRNYAAQCRRWIVKHAATFAAAALIEHRPYDRWEPRYGDTVYCDPPYIGTQGYTTGGFDHDHFWAVARDWAHRGAVVLVSEATAPAGWKVVAEREKLRRLDTVNNPHDRPKRLERIYRYGG